MASKYKQAKSLHCDLPFAIWFVMFPPAVTLQTYCKICFFGGGNWLASLYLLLVLNILPAFTNLA